MYVYVRSFYDILITLLEFFQQCAFLKKYLHAYSYFQLPQQYENFDDYCENFLLSPYKPITNTTWVPTRLCKLQKRCARLTSDKVCQLLAHGRWFSPGTPASSTTKTGRHDIAEILLKVVLSTINQIKSNPVISKRGPLVFVVQSHSLLTLSHVYIL